LRPPRIGAKPRFQASASTGLGGWARWIAKYTFTQTGRPVTNDVRAKMRFRDGLIAEHWDSFSLHSWTRQALGTPGLLLGWSPLLLPSLHWHSYYSLFGSMGAWLALGIALSRWPVVVALLVVGLSGLRAGRSATAIEDWGEESYVRRAGRTLDAMRADLLARCPAPAPYTRFYFTDVPAGAGFLVGDGPALRVWYSDRTFEGRFYREFAARAPSARPGMDRFFRYDAARHWTEIVVGHEDIDRARREDPAWLPDHERLARVLTQGGDWRAAYAEYAKLAEVVPASAEFSYLAGLGAITAGDSLAAKRWLSRVAVDSTASPGQPNRPAGRA